MMSGHIVLEVVRCRGAHGGVAGVFPPPIESSSEGRLRASKPTAEDDRT